MKTISAWRRRVGALCVLTTAAALLFAAPAAAAGRALHLCATLLIPSLFPYMVISTMIVQTGASSILGRPLAPLMRRLFRLPECAAGALILGALCGFPVGAQTACENRKKGELSGADAARLIALANNTGPAFVIGVVGISCWHSREMGIVLYTAQLLSAALIGILFARKADSASCTAPLMENAGQPFLLCLSTSITTAARAMLHVCGFVVFFSVVSALAGELLAALSLSSLTAWITAILEFSSGSVQAAALGGTAGAFLAGFSVGWSGISVFAQCASFAVPADVSLRPAVISKAIQGILCGAAAALWYALRGDIAAPVSAVVGTAIFPAWAVYAEIAMLILFCLLPPLPRK